jgi:hypothetical protein
LSFPFTEEEEEEEEEEAWAVHACPTTRPRHFAPCMPAKNRKMNKKPQSGAGA